MGKLDGRVALVTGGAQGIGRACVERLAADGARIVAMDIDPRGADALRAIDSSGGSIAFVQGDVSTKDGAIALVAAALERFGRVDALVNNAGIVHAAEFLDLAEEDFDRVLRVNLKSMFLCGQAAARQMVAQRQGGAIVNMSSVNAVMTIANQVPYCVSKGGIAQLTKVMAISLASHGIRVNAIGPGTIRTELARGAVLADATARRKILSRTPLGRLGEPSEVAAVASFLLCDDASYVTGQTIYPDGGRLALNYTIPVAEDA
jgi:NAD(P)-dependent dehydrogenase (short-subunit alcohol dehydrogenase family)